MFSELHSPYISVQCYEILLFDDNSNLDVINQFQYSKFELLNLFYFSCNCRHYCRMGSTSEKRKLVYYWEKIFIDCSVFNDHAILSHLELGLQFL